MGKTGRKAPPDSIQEGKMLQNAVSEYKFLPHRARRVAKEDLFSLQHGKTFLEILIRRTIL